MSNARHTGCGGQGRREPRGWVPPLPSPPRPRAQTVLSVVWEASLQKLTSSSQPPSDSFSISSRETSSSPWASPLAWARSTHWVCLRRSADRPGFKFPYVIRQRCRAHLPSWERFPASLGGHVTFSPVRCDAGYFQGQVLRTGSAIFFFFSEYGVGTTPGRLEATGWQRSRRRQGPAPGNSHRWREAAQECQGPGARAGTLYT